MFRFIFQNFYHMLVIYRGFLLSDLVENLFLLPMPAALPRQQPPLFYFYFFTLGSVFYLLINYFPLFSGNNGHICGIFHRD